MFRMRLKEHLHKLPRRFAVTLRMKICKLLLLASLLVATEAARAGKPVLGTVIESDHIYPWEMQRINASEWAESGDATKAFNFLQDQLGRPHIDEVWYDFDSDFFHWRGPATGNRMAALRATVTDRSAIRSKLVLIFIAETTCLISDATG